MNTINSTESKEYTLLERLQMSFEETPYHRDSLHREAAKEIERLTLINDQNELNILQLEMMVRELASIVSSKRINEYKAALSQALKDLEP